MEAGLPDRVGVGNPVEPLGGWEMARSGEEEEEKEEEGEEEEEEASADSSRPLNKVCVILSPLQFTLSWPLALSLSFVSF